MIPARAPNFTPPPPESRWPKSAALGKAGSWSSHRSWKFQQRCPDGAATLYAQFSAARGNQDWLLLVMVCKPSHSNHQPGIIPLPDRSGRREVLRAWKMYGHLTSS